MRSGGGTAARHGGGDAVEQSWPDTRRSGESAPKKRSVATSESRRLSSEPLRFLACRERGVLVVADLAVRRTRTRSTLRGPGARVP